MRLNWNRIQKLQKRKILKHFFRKNRKKRKARVTDAERFKGVPVEKKYLDLSEEDKLCPVCGTPLKEIGEEFVRRELVFVPQN